MLQITINKNTTTFTAGNVDDHTNLDAIEAKWEHCDKGTTMAGRRFIELPHGVGADRFIPKKPTLTNPTH